MLLLEPGKTPYDLRFSVFGIPVRVHPLFWLVTIFTAGFESSPAVVAIWIGTVFFSVLVHELGHAIMFRRFGQDPRIILYAMGGLATVEPSPDSFEFKYSRAMSVRERVIVSLAGPGAGFLFAILVILVINLTHGRFWFYRDFPVFWTFQLGIGPVHDYENLYYLVNDLLFVNIFWGVLNLVPVFPLDGGQVSRELHEAHNPHTGLEKALWVSVIAGGIMVVVGLIVFEIFLIFLFGALAVQNFLLLKQVRGESGWK